MGTSDPYRGTRGRVDKMKIGKIEIGFSGIEFDRVYYFYWWNWLPPDVRYWGPQCMWYDGPHRSFGFWFTNISWSTPWTKLKEEDIPHV